MTKSLMSAKDRLTPPSNFDPSSPASVREWTNFMDLYSTTSFSLPHYSFPKPTTPPDLFKRLALVTFYRNFFNARKSKDRHMLRSMASAEDELSERFVILHKDGQLSDLSLEEIKELLSWSATIIDPQNKNGESHSAATHAIFLWDVLPSENYYDAESHEVKLLREHAFAYQEVNTFMSSRLRGILAKFKGYLPDEAPLPEHITACINTPDLERYAFNLARAISPGQLETLPERYKEALTADRVGEPMLSQVLAAGYRGILTRPQDISKAFHVSLLSHPSKEVRIAAAKAVAHRPPPLRPIKA